MNSDEGMVLSRLAQGPLKTEFGDFEIAVYHDGSGEAIVLTASDVAGKNEVLCRIHSECICSHVFFSTGCDCREQMRDSQKLIAQKGGIIIYLRQEGRGNGAAAHISTLGLKTRGVQQAEAYKQRGFRPDVRNYDLASKVLHYLGIKSVALISSNRQKEDALNSGGIKVTRHRLGPIITLGPAINNLASDVAAGSCAPPIPRNGRQRVLVLGDLNIDYVFTLESMRGGKIVDAPPGTVGGTGYNAAKAFRDANFEPVIFAKVGEDPNGDAIRRKLLEEELFCLLGTSKDKPTGECTMFFVPNDERWLVQQKDNANDYDVENLSQAIALCQLGHEDIAFVVGHPLVRFPLAHSKLLIDKVSRTNAKVVFDIVPHNMHEKISARELNDALGDKVHVLIGEYTTLMKLLGRRPSQQPTEDEIDALMAGFRPPVLVIRHGAGNISRQEVWKRKDGKLLQILEEDTGYENLSLDNRRGFGDFLTAKLISQQGKRLW